MSPIPTAPVPSTVTGATNILESVKRPLGVCTWASPTNAIIAFGRGVPTPVEGSRNGSIIADDGNTGLPYLTVPETRDSPPLVFTSNTVASCEAFGNPLEV